MIGKSLAIVITSTALRNGRSGCRSRRRARGAGGSAACPPCVGSCAPSGYRRDAGEGHAALAPPIVWRSSPRPLHSSPSRPVCTNIERLALAGFLAGYNGLTRQAYELDLRQ